MSDLPPEFLSVEYQAALAHLQRIDDRLLLSGVAGLVISVAVAAHALGSRAELDPGYAWLSPVPFMASVAVLLALFAWRLSARARVTDLRRQAGISAPSASSRASFLHSMLALPAVGWVILYGLTLLYSLRAIYDTSRAAGTTFGVIYFLLNTALALAGLAVWRLWREKTPLAASEVRLVLLPYPGDLLAGMGLFGAGFVVPLLTMGLHAGQLPVLNALFRRDIDFTASVPLAAEMALGLAYFLVIEFLLFPAIQLWRRTLRSETASTRSFIYTQIIVRLLVALGLAFLLGGMPLLVLAALILFQQVVEQLTTPTFEQPARIRFNLLWGGLLVPLRFYAGALVWVGSAWTFTLLLLLACAVAFLAVGLRAERRARQARIQVVRGLEAAPYHPGPSGHATRSAPSASGDGGTGYYLQNVPRWQHAAFLAAGLTALGLIVFQVMAEDCGLASTVFGAYGRCKDGLVIYRQTSPLNALLLLFDLPLLGLLACAGIVRWLERGGAALMMFAVRVRTAGIFVLLAATVGLGVAGLAGELPVLALGSLLTGTAGAALWAER